MKGILKLLNAGIDSEMRLSQQSRIKVINGSIFLAAANILCYNSSYFFFAPELAFDMTWFSTLCAVIILSAWWLNKSGRITLGTHVLMIFSMLSVFYVSYKYLGPDFGFQRFFLIFAMIPFVLFSSGHRLVSMLYSFVNLLLYIFLENGTYDFVFTKSYKYYDPDIAGVFAYLNIFIGFATLVIVMWVFDYIISKDEEALVTALETAKYHARYDYLTDVMNRRSMSEIIKKRMESEALKQIPFSVIMLDIDNFKKINDTNGHSVGDDVLTGLCRVVEETLDGQGEVARWGGEEFIIYLNNISLKHAIALAEAVRKRVEASTLIEGQVVTISLGVSTRQKEDSFSQLLNRADERMYEAKTSGKNCVVADKY